LVLHEKEKLAVTKSGVNKRTCFILSITISP
jgi:hypothetical protein